MTGEQPGRLRVVLVDDDQDFSTVLRRRLELDGMTVETVADGASAIAEVARSTPDVVLLDLDLPGVDGLSVLQRVRPLLSVPIIIVSARPTEEDRIRGLDMGADDYVVKPFSVSELEARIRAVIRRSSTLDPTTDVIEAGPLALDLVRRRCLVRGTPVALTRREFDLCAFLVRNPHRVFSRDELLTAVWGSSSEWQLPTTVTEHIRRIRAKIGDDASSPQLLEAVRGVGYRFAPDVDGGSDVSA